MLTGIHVLLTYTCPYVCDHCFLHSGPSASGVFTRARLVDLLDQTVAIGTVNEVYFEGGEPTLYWPLLREGLRLAKERGLTTGIVTNAYWAESVEDAELWLEPLRDAGLDALTLSEDAFHGAGEDSAAARARAAAERLGMSSGTICIPHPDESDGVRYKGRAADKLTEGRPAVAVESLTECPDEDLRDPGRVHVDPFGHVHLCQGVLLGNVWETPLAELTGAWEPDAHPICGPLLRGGPAALLAEHGLEAEGPVVSACHLCYETRKRLRERFPAALGPAGVYGLTGDPS